MFNVILSKQVDTQVHSTYPFSVLQAYFSSFHMMVSSAAFTCLCEQKGTMYKYESHKLL